MSVFALIAAVLTAIMCSYGLLYPDQLSRRGEFGLRIETPIAMSEMRATYGAMAAMESVGFAVFFRDRVVAAVGTSAMAPVALAAGWRTWRTWRGRRG